MTCQWLPVVTAAADFENDQLDVEGRAARGHAEAMDSGRRSQSIGLGVGARRNNCPPAMATRERGGAGEV